MYLCMSLIIKVIRLFLAAFIKAGKEEVGLVRFVTSGGATLEVQA